MFAQIPPIRPGVRAKKRTFFEENCMRLKCAHSVAQMPDGIEFSDDHHAIFGTGAALTAREKIFLLQIEKSLQNLWENTGAPGIVSDVRKCQKVSDFG